MSWINHILSWFLSVFSSNKEQNLESIPKIYVSICIECILAKECKYYKCDSFKKVNVFTDPEEAGKVAVCQSFESHGTLDLDQLIYADNIESMELALSYARLELARIECGNSYPLGMQYIHDKIIETRSKIIETDMRYL